MISSCDGSEEQAAMSDAKKISKAMRVLGAIAIISTRIREGRRNQSRVERARCIDVILVALFETASAAIAVGQSP
jgi:hypothetical protein